jgi:hypothetical protein
MDKKLSNEEFWKLMDILKYSNAGWPRDRTQTPREVAKSLTWRRKGLWSKNNYELRHKKSLEEAINANLAREQKSPEQQLNLWKDRPRMAKEEIPNDAFQILQKQHSVEEDDS